MPKILQKKWVYAFSLIGPLAFFSVYALWFPILIIVLFNVPRLVTIIRTDRAASFSRYLPYFVLPALGALSAVWTLIPANAVITAAKFSGYFCVAILAGLIIRQATETERRKIVFSTAVGLLIAFPVVLLDVSLSGGIWNLYKSYEFNPSAYNRGTAITACLLFPLAFGLFRYTAPWRAVVFPLICLGVIFGLYMEAAKLAVVLGVIVFALVRWQRKLFWPSVLVPLTITIIFPVFFMTPSTEQEQCRQYYMKSSAYHRIMIYRFSTSKILEKPIAGWGMDSSRSIPGGEKRVVTITCNDPVQNIPIKLNAGGNLPLHPHNAGIQIWLELGLIGALCLAATVLLLIRRIERNSADNQGRAIVAATFCIVCLIYNISFGLWQSWLMFTMILLGCFIMALQRGPEPSEEPQ
jgi:exopolysaccharide production protein ExoQ